jgi:Tfp pilus assembly protein PilF
MKVSSPRAQFEQGHHGDVVSSITFPGNTSEEATALIGSLAFLGRFEEAIEIFNLRGARLKPHERSRARFALALAFMRVSKFKSARFWLKASLTEDSLKNKAGKEHADVYQGLAVYHYYLGNFEKAASNARKALNIAIKSSDTYIHAFAIDLYGHSLVQTGKRSAGLQKLAQAQDLARKKGGSDPYTPARLAYEAEAGLRPSTIVTEIEEQIKNLKTEDTYTKANLILELARQLTLRGQWVKARAFLDQVSSLIYAFQNRRQEALLQLRLAELAYRQGDASAATHFLQASRRCLNKIADSIYEARVIGLEHKIERQLFNREPSLESLKRLETLTNSTSALINSRIVLRTRGECPSEVQPGEYPLGDLLDLVAQNPRENSNELFKCGYLGLWPEAHGLKLGESSLVILDNLQWVAVSREGVIKAEAELSSMSYKILRLLSQGTVDKETLVREAWGYIYDQLRHDPMIYTAIASLRKSMGAVSFWIETQDEGWALKNHGQQVTFTDRKAVNIDRPSPILKKDSHFDTSSSELNWRQLKAMSKSKPKEPWTVPRYKEIFKVSTMTAWRDLDVLAKAGYLTRIGRGRATVYLHANAIQALNPVQDGVENSMDKLK